MRAVRTLGVGVLLAVGALPLAAGSARAATSSVGPASCTSYAYAGMHGVDPNGFPAPNETSFAAGCLDQNGLDVARHEVGPRATVAFGDPGTWAGSARAAGFTTGSTAVAGTLIEVGSGSSTPVTGLGGAADTNLVGPYLGVVVDAGGGLATFRVYDAADGSVREYRLVTAGAGSPTYLDLSGGHRVGAAPAATPTTTPTHSVTPSAAVTATSAAATVSTTPPTTASTAAPTAVPTTAPSAVTATAAPGVSDTAASGTDSDGAKRASFGAVAGVLIFVVLSLILRVLVARRRQ